MIKVEQVPLEQVNVDKLRTLFASPEYALLKMIIGAYATKEIVGLSNASMYDTPQAEAQFENHRQKAKEFTVTLDVLDEIEGNPQWFTLKLDQRR